MSNIQIRKSGPQQNITPSAAAWEPTRWISRMMGWDPFREMDPFFAEMPAALAPSLNPAFEVKETKDGYLFKADLPGVKQADIDVSLTGNRLTISGKRDAEKEDKGDTFYMYERSYGSFTRAFTLPEGVDSATVRAELKDGVLSVVLPKKPESLPRKIQVTAETKKA